MRGSSWSAAAGRGTTGSSRRDLWRRVGQSVQGTLDSRDAGSAVLSQWTTLLRLTRRANRPLPGPGGHLRHLAKADQNAQRPSVRDDSNGRRPDRRLVSVRHRGAVHERDRTLFRWLVEGAGLRELAWATRAVVRSKWYVVGQERTSEGALGRGQRPASNWQYTPWKPARTMTRPSHGPSSWALEQLSAEPTAVRQAGAPRLEAVPV